MNSGDDISDEQLVQRFPEREITYDNANFYRGRLQRRLLVNQCTDCRYWHQPPRPLCPRCWSTNIEATEVRGRGTVHTVTLHHQGPPGVDYSSPHPVVVVELEEQEGLRFTSAIVGVPAQDVTIGLRVRLAWIDRDGAPYPVFEPSDERGS